MVLREAAEPIKTARLELVALLSPFVEALVAADRVAAGAAIQASVSEWLTSDPSHAVQLHLAAQAAETEGFPGLGRAIVLAKPERPRRVIGTIGFHGPPDEHSRFEVSCRIHPARRSRGYAVEALEALIDWATARYGASRFLVALPARREQESPVPVEIALRAAGTVDLQIDHLAVLLKSRHPNR